MVKMISYWPPPSSSCLSLRCGTRGTRRTTRRRRRSRRRRCCCCR